ncbi:FHA domain-containing protein [Pseudomonas fluorescens]|uniref:FHA domain-containing protein n=1 Tax=Pseudomonas fluorescens TaxID=294 RepID=UPI001BEAAB8F|nr:FHA domain-containing protein [Pseudomonas fluorescens]MBT2375466.1 type III secretion protein HrpQ [Pseudomonas fluorescens]
MFELRVLTGLHQGAALPLCGDVWTLGSSETGDLTLYDPGIEDQHCVLQNLGDTWLLTEIKGQITDGEGHIAEGAYQVASGVPFALNGVWLMVTAADTLWDADSNQGSPELFVSEEGASGNNRGVSVGGRTGVLLSKVLVLLCASVTILGAVLLWRANTQRFAGAAPQVMTSEPAPVVKIVLEDAAATRQILQRMLRERELQSQINMIDQPGKIVLQGHLDQGDLSQLIARMLERFEQQYQSPVQVLSASAPAIPTLPFTIRQISHSRLASILTSEGRRMFVGDEYRGVRLIEVNDSTLIFDGDRRIEVSW